MAPKFYRLNEIFPEQAALCESFGIRARTEAQKRAGETPAQRSRRTAVHECGHVLAYVLDGVRFDTVEIHPNGQGWVHSPPPRGPAYVGAVESRIAIDVAAAAAEELVLGAVDPSGAWHDLLVAEARAAGDAARVREQVERVRRLLTEHRQALDALTTALVGAGRLSALECRDILRRADVDVPEPRFDIHPPPEEKARCQAAYAAMQKVIEEHPLVERDATKRKDDEP
jgi:hypothetical protein